MRERMIRDNADMIALTSKPPISNRREQREQANHRLQIGGSKGNSACILTCIRIVGDADKELPIACGGGTTTSGNGVSPISRKTLFIAGFFISTRCVVQKNFGFPMQGKIPVETKKISYKEICSFVDSHPFIFST